MKIIITGASGFVGKNLSQFLKNKEHDIDAVSLRSEWTLDINADALIHLAGKAHDIENSSEAEDYFKINTELTKKVFDEFLKSNIKDFIYFSSVKAVADCVVDILHEDHMAEPKTPYGKSKLLAEEYLLSQALPGTKRLFVIRPCMIHGPGNKGNLNLLYKMVKMGMPWPLGAFDNKRSFLSIDNVNFLVLQLLENKKITSGIYNVADDEFLSTNELIKIIDEALGKRTKQLNVYPDIINIFSKVGDKIKLPLNSERLKKLTENYKVSNHKIKSALDIRQLPVSTKEGLIKTIKSFQHK
ncbi:NAD-dependent epimerase/dehydratase family protein [Chryseobacterium takakiae]|jgi:nucleoside-diphosphate-sugar epimerase|uniref:Nucleoside-diphosphate-sugar epimerase n=1 Tax=Chryseobacterium takakiae TaxID=1302685 RepID=A0A1M4Z6I8_9FLAO|nr:NAD-dependent epimerase/dehydratase family protein [Chryseobacterium takakiae]SHF13558.1 Nucleoside-diphosphate-sugar epimerase [Chryseobacterium takakiae]